MTKIELKRYLPYLPQEIVEALQNEFIEIQTKYLKGILDASELNGGRFSEAVFRYLEWKESGGSFTPISVQINRQRIYQKVFNNSNVNENLRFHVLKCADLIFDFRNKRDVAHLGSDIDTKGIDSKIIIGISKWVLSEIIRIESNLCKEKIQEIIYNLSEEIFPFIETIAGDLIVLTQNLMTKEKILVALYSIYPKPLSVQDLQKSVNYKNISRFNGILEKENNERLIYIKDHFVYITKIGLLKANNLLSKNNRCDCLLE